MKATDFIEGKYLNSATAAPLAGKDLVIYEVKPEMIREKNKMLMGFENIEKGLIVNKANIIIMVNAFGEDTDEWIGCTVHLEITERTYKDAPIMGILIVPHKDIERQDIGTATPPSKKKR